MEYFVSVITALFINIIAENIIFTRSIGTDLTAFIGKNRGSVPVFGAAVTYLCTVTDIFVWLFDKNYGSAQNYRFYQPIFYITVLCLVYFASLALIWKFSEETAEKAKKYLHFAVFNSAVLGTMLLSSKNFDTFSEYFFGGLGSGLGFSFALFLTAPIYEKTESGDVPAAFRGYPLLMIYIGILSMAFFGITGKVPAF